MPLSADPQLNELAHEILAEQRKLAGDHPGYRPVHAKGLFLSGTFTPTARAAALSAAAHFAGPPVPATARFSNGTGLPALPDAAPEGRPKGLAVRFHLPADPADGRRVHTDIIAHSLNLFPVRDGATFRDLLRTLSAGKDAASAFLAAQPAAAAFVGAAKPTPASYARLAYYALNAFRLVGVDGAETAVRYRWVPAEGLAELDAAAAAAKGPDYLVEELERRVAPGGAGVAFTLVAQIAAAGDTTDDATVAWPDTRELVELGTLRLEQRLDAAAPEQKRVIFDPVPRVPGVKPSDDPLLALRGEVYLLSGQKRREEDHV